MLRVTQWKDSPGLGLWEESLYKGDWITIIAGSPLISLSLIVGKSKCDVKASVTCQTVLFFPRKESQAFHSSANTIPGYRYCVANPPPPYPPANIAPADSSAIHRAEDCSTTRPNEFVILDLLLYVYYVSLSWEKIKKGLAGHTCFRVTLAFASHLLSPTMSDSEIGG